MAVDLHDAAKMLVLQGIKRLASDATMVQMRGKLTPLPSEDEDEKVGDVKKELAEDGLDESALPAGPEVDETPDVEDTGDEELGELESSDNGLADEPDEEDDIAKMKKKAKMK